MSLIPLLLLLPWAAICPTMADDFLPVLSRSAINPRFAEYDPPGLIGGPTGDILAKHDVDAIEWVDVAGPEAKRVWDGEERVEVRDLALRVDWPTGPTEKYEGTLFLFRNCEEVVVEDVAIVHANADYRGQHSFLFENCGSVTVRDVYSAGAVGRSHIRLEGCREYLIERVEISGWDYGEAGVRCGGGIFVNNGVTQEDGTIHLYVKDRRELVWGAIRDSWFHDYLAQDEGEWRNQDGIAFHAPSDGIVFNCVFDRWIAGDGAIDDSHRRHDDAYHGKVHRIERCLFRDCNLVKTNGAQGSADCVVVWANNVYVNTWLADYHKGWTNWHIHETYAFAKSMPVFVKNWGMGNGLTVFANCLLHAPEGVDVIYWQSGNATSDGYRLFRALNMLYFLPQPKYWMRGQGAEIIGRDLWLEEGLERGCRMAGEPVEFVSARDGDWRLRSPSSAIGFGSPMFLDPNDKALRVSRDFTGAPRPDPPSAGAFERAQ